MSDGLCAQTSHQVQQTEDESDQEHKHKSRLVICGNFAAWGEHSTTTTNLDVPLLRLMLSLASAKDTTWSSVDITSAFLNADIHEDDAVLVTPPPVLVKLQIVKPNTVWHVKRAIYGLREAPHLWQEERDQQLRELQFQHQEKPAHLVQSSSQSLVHCRRPICSTLMDTALQPFLEKRPVDCPIA